MNSQNSQVKEEFFLCWLAGHGGIDGEGGFYQSLHSSNKHDIFSTQYAYVVTPLSFISRMYRHHRTLSEVASPF